MKIFFLPFASLRLGVEFFFAFLAFFAIFA